MINIIVCIKQVPCTTDLQVDPVTGSFSRQSAASMINPDDLHALEEALQMKDKLNAKLTVISMGPAQAEQILRESMAMGADHAVLICDQKLSGSDTYATAYVLSEAVKKLKGDVVFTGKQSLDGVTAQVGTSLAEFLGWPHISYVQKISHKDDTFIIQKLIEGGRQILELKPPCLFTVMGGFNQPRYMGAGFSNKMEFWDAQTLGIAPETVGFSGSPTKIFSTRARIPQQTGKLIETSSSQAADMIYDKLKELLWIKE